MILAAVPFLIQVDKNILVFVRLIGDVAFYLGILLMGTTDRAKLKTIWATTNIVDWLIGDIPKDVVVRKPCSMNVREKYLFISASALLVIYSIVDYVFVARDKLTDLVLFLIGMVFILYTLFLWRSSHS